MKKILTSRQKVIINTDGYVLVKAPPGSGKTFTLCEKIKFTQSKSRKRRNR